MRAHALQPSAPLYDEARHPPTIGVHSVANALCAIEPERTRRVSIKTGVMPAVAVPALTGTLVCQPFAFGFGEVKRPAHGPTLRAVTFQMVVAFGLLGYPRAANYRSSRSRSARIWA